MRGCANTLLSCKLGIEFLFAHPRASSWSGLCLHCSPARTQCSSQAKTLAFLHTLRIISLLSHILFLMTPTAPNSVSYQGSLPVIKLTPIVCSGTNDTIISCSYILPCPTKMRAPWSQELNYVHNYIPNTTHNTRSGFTLKFKGSSNAWATSSPCISCQALYWVLGTQMPQKRELIFIKYFLDIRQ